MNLFVRTLRPALAAVLLAAATAAAAQIVPAARVNGVTIALERLDRQYEALLRERRIHPARMMNPAQAKQIKREALDQLIRVELLHQQGVASGIAVDEAEVDKAAASFREGFRNDDAYRRRLESMGLDEAGWRQHLRKTLVGDRYAERVVEREVRIVDDDIDAFYRVNTRLFKREEQLRARHILIAVPPDAGEAPRAQARARIDALAARVAAGEDFETLARQNSDDPTRQWGGELDAFGRGAMPRAFEDAAFALQAGQVSAPVLTPRGWHLIRVEERLPANTVPLDDALRGRIRDWLRQSRGKEAIDREVEQLRSLGQVELLTPL